MRFKIVLAMIAIAALTACSPSSPIADQAGNGKIGNDLAAVSSSISEQGDDQAKIALYDPTVCMIHQFDMGNARYMRTLKPVDRGGDHRVLFDPSGNYVIDFSSAHISIFDQNGAAQDPRLSFVGMPTTASFRPSLGYLVLQDDVKTAGLVKINAEGVVIGRAPMGQIVHDDVSITAGDIDDQGHLIISMSDDTIGIVDLDATIATRQWTLLATFPSGLIGVNWLAAIRDVPDQILVKTTNVGQNVQVAIIDTSAKILVGTPYTVPLSRTIVKNSKTYDPHFLIKDNGDNFSDTTTLLYPQASTLKTKTLPDQVRNVLSSTLRLADDRWTFIDSDIPWANTYFWDDPNGALTGRQLKKYIVSQMLALNKIGLPDQVRVQVSESHVFELFPSPLGLAQNLSITDGSIVPLDDFNRQFFHHDPCQ
jgi:hypothetical protein